MYYSPKAYEKNDVIRATQKTQYVVQKRENGGKEKPNESTKHATYSFILVIGTDNN